MTFSIHKHGNCISYTTKDGSVIREIMKAANQSLAEAIVAPGQETAMHYHLHAEEIYYILRGWGLMFLEDEKQEVASGDAILIPPGRRHIITNTGTEDLIFLCCCAPGYQHADTVLV